MTRILPPSPPYKGPAAHDSGPGNKPIHRIVIHSTVGPCTPGAAADVAAYFRSPQSGGSAHYVVDPATTLQVVYDSVVAWHAPPNVHSLGIEMCDFPSSTPNGRWLTPSHRAMLRRVIQLTAQLCGAYDVPPVWLTVEDLRAGKHGITSHANVSQAFHQSTHWDPGVFPRRRFIRGVYRELSALKGR